ncbi:hypothetical protein [Vogesella sp. LIG4]|uniref:hypothetical protein n=1 Tax=Vogesella sp. LIG4 TaxID=1192162 RepID=UPI00081FBCB7|nr:hypothetical protein [Vogesella sp. LIG4]SCK16345.1 hypothetical protein PSELUDRAFT_1657 [Vogesella sp. LIG4]
MQQAIVLLQELLELGKQEQWDVFASRSKALAALDYRIIAAGELGATQAAQLQADLLQAQQLLQQVSQLAETEREQIIRHLVMISNQTKLNATYGP